MNRENTIAYISKQFALQIITVCKYLLDKYRGDLIVPVLSKQLLRSGTSIAANVAESKNAQSRNDFQSKLSISLKEADETKLWLELIHESGYLTDDEFGPVYDDNQKIIATLINIIKRLQDNKE